jgi:hypothetical protein
MSAELGQEQLNASRRVTPQSQQSPAARATPTPGAYSSPNTLMNAPGQFTTSDFIGPPAPSNFGQASQQYGARTPASLGRFGFAPLSSGPNPIEAGAASAYQGLQTGFTDIFVAGASTEKFLATGSANVNLTPGEASRLATVSSTAAYIFPGGATFKGLGETNAPPTQRIFDVGVGVLPFIPFGEVGGALAKAGPAGQFLSQFGGSIGGKFALGSGLGAAGGIAYGETPTQIAENALIGGAGFVGPGLIGKGVQDIFYEKVPLTNIEFNLADRTYGVVTPSTPTVPVTGTQAVTSEGLTKAVPLITSEQGIAANASELLAGQSGAEAASRISPGPTTTVLRPWVQNLQGRIGGALPGRFSLSNLTPIDRILSAFSEDQKIGFSESASEFQPGTDIVRRTQAPPPPDITTIPKSTGTEIPTGTTEKTVLETVPKSETTTLDQFIQTSRDTAESQIAATKRGPAFDTTYAFYTTPPGFVPPGTRPTLNVQPTQRVTTLPKLDTGPSQNVTPQQNQGFLFGRFQGSFSTVDTKPDTRFEFKPFQGSFSTVDQLPMPIQTQPNPTKPILAPPGPVYAPPPPGTPMRPQDFPKPFPLSAISSGASDTYRGRLRIQFKFGKKRNPINIVFGGGGPKQKKGKR